LSATSAGLLAAPPARSPQLACTREHARAAQAEAFRQHQQSAAERARGQLWSHWLPKSLDVFRRLPPLPINGDSAAYFR
jgi:hypothetical protein